MGKAYASRRSMEGRPVGDFYVTPRSLVWVAEGLIRRFFGGGGSVLDPCCGSGVLGEELMRLGYEVGENDLYFGGLDYLECVGFEGYKRVLMNPPFSEWDRFVEKAKSHAERVVVLGRLNYLGTSSRFRSGLWGGLRGMWAFTRYVDYRTPERGDGLFHVGAMATGWFIWERGYEGKPELGFLDVQDWAKLGSYVGL